MQLNPLLLNVAIALPLPLHCCLLLQCILFLVFNKMLRSISKLGRVHSITSLFTLFLLPKTLAKPFKVMPYLNLRWSGLNIRGRLCRDSKIFKRIMTPNFRSYDNTDGLEYNSLCSVCPFKKMKENGCLSPQNRNP